MWIGKQAKQEDGVVLVTAILASAVVLILSVSAVTLAVHNTDSSAYDRRRLVAVNAAEGGIDYYYSLLGSSALKTLTSASMPSGWTMSSSCVLTGTTTTTPSATFTVTPAFTTTGGSAYTCPAFIGLNPNATYELYVTLTSVGNASGVSRTMQSRARLSATGQSSTLPSAAIIGNTVTLRANVDVESSTGSQDANIYSDGNYTMSAGVLDVKGSIYAQGTATIGGGQVGQVAGDLWAKSYVNVSGAVIGGSVISSGTTTTTCPTGSSPASAAICLSGNTSVAGNAKAGVAISTKNPAVVYGTTSAYTSGIVDPPTAPGLPTGQTYPTYDVSTSQPSTDFPGILPVSGCAAAQSAIDSWIDSGSSTAKYIRLQSCSKFTFDRNAYALKANLGIVSDGGVELTTPVKLSSADGATHTVYFFLGGSQLNAPTSTPCTNGWTDTGTGTTNVLFQADSGSNISYPLKAIIFTPKACTALLKSNGFTVTGQIFAGTVLFRSQTTLIYAPITLGSDTTNGSAGSLVDIVYRREIKNS
jgi:hypothetical protein